MSTPNESEKVNNKPVPFRRVVSEKVEVDPRLQDNSFEAKVNALKFKKAKATLCIIFFWKSKNMAYFGHLLCFITLKNT